MLLLHGKKSQVFLNKRMNPSAAKIYNNHLRVTHDFENSYLETYETNIFFEKVLFLKTQFLLLSLNFGNILE